jgi:hypothetical protein
MAKTVKQQNVAHAIAIRQAVAQAVDAKWPNVGIDARRVLISDLLATYNAQMIARAAGK